MSAQNYVHWMEVQELLKETYPNQPLPEAYESFINDMLSKYPQEVARILASNEDQIIEFAEIAGLFFNRWGYLAIAKAVRLCYRNREQFYTYLFRAGQETGGNIDKDIIILSDQLQAEIINKIESIKTGANLASDVQEGVTKQQGPISWLKEMLTSYHRPDIYGQIIGFFAMAEAIRQIRRLADQAERISQSMAGIDRNLESINSRGGYFPNHIYSYVRMMISNHSNPLDQYFFVVFNKSTVWHPKFAELDQANPLGDSFLGHRADLDELCAFLAEEVRPRVGRDARAVALGLKYG